MSRIIDQADALVALLNENEFGQPFVAVRHYNPTFKLSDMTTLHVTVAAKNSGEALTSRVDIQQDVEIDVGIQRRLPTINNAESDVLMDLVEGIADYVRQTRAVGSGFWLSTANAIIYDPEDMSERRLFTSVLTFTFRLVAT